MKKYIYKLISAFLLFALFAKSQTLSIPLQVINSSGGSYTFTSGSQAIHIDYNIGETVIETISNSNTLITQGFLQPDLGLRFSVTHTITPISCFKKNDGKIEFDYLNVGTGNVAITYTFIETPSATPVFSTCIASNPCKEIDSLAPGHYTFVINYSSGNYSQITSFDFSVEENPNTCPLIVYNFITPNDDGDNEKLYIKNIEQYPDNTVYIYNRWGIKLEEIHSYNNEKKFWTGKDVPSATYFYVIDLGEGSKPVKGFIELIKE